MADHASCRQCVPVTDTDRPAPPPLTVSLATLLGNLQQLRQPRTAPGEGTGGDAGATGLGVDTYDQALANLRAVATACGVDWEDVEGEQGRRSVLAE